MSPRSSAIMGRPRLLSDRQARAIREQAAEGVPLVKLARKYRVSPQLVTAIVRGWRYTTAGGPIRTDTKDDQ